MTSAKGLNATGTDVVVGGMVAGVVVGVALVISVVKVILIPYLHLVLIISVVKAILIPSGVFPLLILLVEKNILILLSLFTPHTITLAESTILTTNVVDATVAEVRREDADVKVENLLSSVFVPFLRVRLLSIDCMPQKKVWSLLVKKKPVRK
jgi:hypothetical protein